MKPVQIFHVLPSLPAPLEPLRALANNLHWAWDHETIELFRRLDSDLWETTGHNPVAMLGTIDQAKLEAAARDDAYLAHLERVEQKLAGYLSGESTWFRRRQSRERGPESSGQPLVAYFSAEFGLTECLSIFAGGLGILAGDHLKSASDLGVPLVGVGLLYQQGYFRQYLNASGWQQESYVDNDFENLPVTLERTAEGAPVTVSVDLPSGPVRAQVWRADVGRVRLYLLDTNYDGNQNPHDRDTTDQLYGGDLDMRMRQEILLGIGGYRALEALGLKMEVFHMNEGHSAFLALEHIRRLMETRGLNFNEARAVATAGLVFTTHTPVEAGHDYFPPGMMDHYFGGYIGKLGLNRNEFLALGRRNPGDDHEKFCMTVLAMRLAGFSNGVSVLHGEVSRKMWKCLWPGLPLDEVPVKSITNGVHFRSWISLEMNQLYDRYLGPNWRAEPGEQSLWRRVESIPAEELWRTHERRRERLVAFARRTLRAQLLHRGAPPSEVEAAEEALNPEALTIGFARRFATYKRGTLLLRDPERLKRLLNDPARPLQVVYAGKAHPRDDAGKDLIRQVVEMSRRPEFRGKLVFLENYDMAIARYMVQGADVWLNTPLRPLEASGTSGMKALANGVLNVSTLDGWWDEAWRSQTGDLPGIGWAIGNAETYDNPDYQDQVEAEALYTLLESEILPAFYDRRADGLPRRWIARMKASIGTQCAVFNTHRMVREYTERYLAAAARTRELEAGSAARARALAAWMSRTAEAWHGVRVEALAGEGSHLHVGERLTARAKVWLGGLKPEDVAVELYVGLVDARGEIRQAAASPMQQVGERDGALLYEGSAAPCGSSGRHGYTVRVRPAHPDLPAGYLPGCISWA